MNDRRQGEQTTDSSGVFRKIRVVVLALCVAGFVVSAELTRVHVGVHLDPEFDSICAVSEQVNCETVARSMYAVFLGIPVSVWGMIAYLLLGFLAAMGSGRRRDGSFFLSGIFHLAGLGASAVAGLLAWVSHAIIGTLCPWCMVLYGINGLLLACSIALLVHHRRHPAAAVMRDLRVLLSHRRQTLLLAGAALLLPLGVLAFVPPYWEHTGFSGIPKMDSGIDAEGNHWIGARNPVLTIFEYSDYQCPYCRGAHREARMMVSQRRSTVRLVHRHVPMDRACNPGVRRLFHDRACEFSFAVECAGRQGKFWEMNDALFAIQDTVPAVQVDVLSVAGRIGLDTAALKRCMDGPEVRRIIRAHLDEAERKYVPGTPTFYLGRLPHPGIFRMSFLDKAIELARRKQPSRRV